jgi:hypothetical protein
LDLGWLVRIRLAISKSADYLVGFVASEPAPGLTLGEPHRTPRVPKIVMSGGSE